VTLTGSIDPKSFMGMKSDLQRLVEEGTRRFIFDCENLSYVNSTGMAYFVSLSGEIEPEGGTIAIAALDPKIHVIFKMMGLLELFHFFPTYAEALEEIRSSEELSAEAAPGESAPETSEPPGTPLPEPAVFEAAPEEAKDVVQEAPAPAPRKTEPRADSGPGVLVRFFRWLFRMGRPAA